MNNKKLMYLNLKIISTCLSGTCLNIIQSVLLNKTDNILARIGKYVLSESKYLNYLYHSMYDNIFSINANIFFLQGLIRILTFYILNRLIGIHYTSIVVSLKNIAVAPYFFRFSFMNDSQISEV